MTVTQNKYLCWALTIIIGGALSTGCIMVHLEPLAQPVATSSTLSRANERAIPGVEYQVIDGIPALTDYDLDEVANLLNSAGEDGWDVIGSMGHIFILRRRDINKSKWEYHAIPGEPSVQSNRSNLRPLGEEGWQLATVTRNEIIVLKRPLDSTKIVSWDYEILDTYFSRPTDVANRLNLLGAEGWDVGELDKLAFMQRSKVYTDLWEYRVLNDIAVSSEDLSALLNPLGEEGWDLAGLQGTRVIMKRKLLESRRYEYQKLLNAAPILLGEDVDFLAFLNPLGEVGWEVGGIVAPVIVMKRLLPRDNE